MMERSRVRWPRAAALAPLAGLSCLWTVHLLAGAPSGRDADLSPGLAVPAEVVEAPASYSQPGRLGFGVPRGNGAKVVAAATTNRIPSAALAAYQRAETVMDAVDEACRIDWQLVAAIGRVESDHGRYGGNTLGADGISRPGIFGIALDGTNGTAEIRDTDAGRLDDDTVYDRAVGPMQFIPSTWSEVGVDADGDAKRDPQDIDDAALASAVYLCSGRDDLGGVAGRRAAVHRYNHSTAYVDLVLSLREAYLDGDYASVPNYVTAAVTFTAHHGYPAPVRGAKLEQPSEAPAPPATKDGATASTPASIQPEPSQPPPSEPAPSDHPVRQLRDTVRKTVEDTTRTLDQAVTSVLSLPQAILRCTSLGYTAITTPTQWNACVANHTE